MQSLRSTFVLGSILLLAVGTAAIAGDPGNNNGATITYKVTIENLAATQPMSPAVVATHKQPVGMFEVGDPASPGLEAIAENGNQIPMFNRLSGLRHVNDVVDVGQPLTPSGTTFGDFSDSVTFMLEGRPADRLSMAMMLICTNDGFTGLDHARLPKFGSRTYLTAGYDAGTEDNTELSIDIVDPCSALGPVVIGGDPDGNINDDVDTDPAEPIRHHPNVLEVGDLLDAHAWNDPVAKVTVTRVDGDARAFSAPLTGAGEVPPLASDASGRVRMELVEYGGSYALNYELEVDISGVRMAHIHYGAPNENGGVVAFLYGPDDPIDFSGVIAEGTIEQADLLGAFQDDIAGFLDALQAGDLYVNVHTEANPAGEIRGQLGAADGVGQARRERAGKMRRMQRPNR